MNKNVTPPGKSDKEKENIKSSIKNWNSMSLKILQMLEEQGKIMNNLQQYSLQFRRNDELMYSGSIVHNGPKLEVTPMSVIRGHDKSTVLYS